MNTGILTLIEITHRIISIQASCTCPLMRRTFKVVGLYFSTATIMNFMTAVDR